MEGSFVVLRGREVKFVGSGMDSTRVTLERGSVVRREVGRSVGEHAMMAWRR